MALLDALQPLLPESGEALALGVRRPELLGALADCGLDVVAIDPSAAAIEELDAARTGISALLDDPATAALDPEIAEVVLCTLIPTLPAVTTLKATVRPGGLAVLSLGGDLDALVAGRPAGWFRGWELLHSAQADGRLELIARKPELGEATMREEEPPRPPVQPMGPGGWNWSALRPYHPLPPGDPAYMPRPRKVGTRLARMVRRGLTPAALCGPAGHGKTTELHRVAHLLREEVECVRLDLQELGAAELAPSELLYELSRTLVEGWVARDLPTLPSRLLVKNLRASDPRFPQGDGKAYPPHEMAAIVLGQLAAALGRGPLCLLLDGLDGIDPEPARTQAAALLALREHARLVIAIDSRLAHGPESAELLGGYRVVALTALRVHEGAPGRSFLMELARRRLAEEGLPTPVEQLLEDAAIASGGVPRTFLQLVQSAAAYSENLNELPEGLREARRDTADALRRLLREGDLTALVRADGTGGQEIPTGRRTRLLEHGLLLEYTDVDDVILRPHPLVARLVARHRAQG